MDLICPACGKPCSAVPVDHGIGHYEYWGAPGNDVQMMLSSDCCEEPFPIEVEQAIIDEQSLIDYDD